MGGVKNWELFGYFSWGCVYGTIEVTFGYTQVWEEGKDAYYNPFPPTTSIMPKFTMIIKNLHLGTLLTLKISYNSVIEKNFTYKLVL